MSLCWPPPYPAIAPATPAAAASILRRTYPGIGQHLAAAHACRALDEWITVDELWINGLPGRHRDEGMLMGQGSYVQRNATASDN